MGKSLKGGGDGGSMLFNLISSFLMLGASQMVSFLSSCTDLQYGVMKKKVLSLQAKNVEI